MVLGIYLEIQNMDSTKYAAINARLCDLDRPEDRIFHAAFHVGESIQVFDVWESLEAFQAFGEHLLPLATAYGVDPGQPRIGEIERIVVHDEMLAATAVR